MGNSLGAWVSQSICTDRERIRESEKVQRTRMPEKQGEADRMSGACAGSIDADDL